MLNGKTRTAVRHVPDYTAHRWRVRGKDYFCGTTHRASQASSFFVRPPNHRCAVHVSEMPPAKTLSFASTAGHRRFACLIARSTVQARSLFIVRATFSGEPSFLVGSRIHAGAAVLARSPVGAYPHAFIGHCRVSGILEVYCELLNRS
jgi:hypothetical protein